MAKNIFKIKFFLKADSEENLIVKMRQNNLLNNREFDYDTPNKIDDSWYVWFRADSRFYKRVK